MGDAEREELARRQAELVGALADGAEPPADFDEDQVKLAARTLVRKRMRAVAKGWPETAGGLGAVFEPAFLDYARRHPLPEDQRADGAGFAEFLAGRRLLADGGKVEWAFWRARRGWPVRVARVRGGVVVVVRIWGARMRKVFVGWGIRGGALVA
jgi:hypothetical protein